MCRTIFSPITGEEVRSKTWDGIFAEVNNEKLADKLYSQLASNNFTMWFGDWMNNSENASKIVNENGEPLLLFHSSTKSFNEFDEEFSQELGFHFGTELSAIERHSPWVMEKGEELDMANLRRKLDDARSDLKEEISDFTIYPVFLNIRNLIEGVDYLAAEKDENMSQDEYDILYDIGKRFHKDEMTKLIIAFHQKGTITRDEAISALTKERNLKDILDADGYWYINQLENKGEKSYVVFDVNNIKSLKNKGIYSQTNNNIYYNLGLAKSQQKFASIPEAVLFGLSKNSIVNKFTPDNSDVEERWYFNQSKGGIEENQKFYHQYMSWNNLNRDMFKEGRTLKGVPYLIPNYGFDLKDAIQENDERIHKDKYESLISFLKEKFNIPEDKIHYITKKEFAEKFPNEFHENAQSVYTKRGIYFFTNNLTSDITAEELLHPFIYTVKELNKPLFNNLLAEAQKHYPLLRQKIQALYSSQIQSVRDQELVTQTLSRVFNNVYENQEPKSFIEVIKDFVNWMKVHLQSLLNKFGTGKVINIDVTDLHPQTSLEEIAQLINATDTEFNVKFPEGSFYNLSTNPEDFNKVVTTLLTDKRVEAKVDEIFAKLPNALKDIKKRLTSKINDGEKRELQNVIKDIEAVTGEDKETLLKSQLKGVLTTVQLFNTLEDELNTVDRSDMNDNLKLAYYMSVLKTANALDGFKDLMLDLNDELRTYLRRTVNHNVNEFHRLLSDSISAKDRIAHKIQKLIVSPVLEELGKSNEHSYLIPIQNIDREISELNTQIDKTSSQPEKNRLQNKIEPLLRERKAILTKAPTKENLEKVFNSQFKDANQLSYIFESKIANGHPLVNTLQSIVNEVYDLAGANMLNSKNEAQTASDEYTKKSGIGLRDMNKRFEGIGDDLVPIPTSLKFKKDSETELDLDEKGNPQYNYIHQNALVQKTDNEYIKKFLELEMIKDHHFKLHFEKLKNNITDSKETEQYREAYDNFEKFKKENVQRQYKEEYYNFRAILDQKVGDKTVRSITNNIYDELDQLRDALGRADSSNRADIIRSIKIKNIELKKLKSDYQDNGEKKDEEGLKIAEILKQYSKDRYEYGNDVLTSEGETKYKFDLDAIDFKKDQYTPEQYKDLVDNIQQKIISQDYFEAFSTITESINNLTNMLSKASSDSEAGKFANSDDLKEKRTDIYKEIRDLTKPYRDEEQIIDGIILTELNPSLVSKIKEMQQYVEDLKFQSTRLTSLSPSESEEYGKLRKNDDKTAEQQKRYEELSDKRQTLKKFKADNIHIINELNSLFKDLGSLSDTSTTSYYDDMRDKEVAILEKRKDIIDAAIDFVNTRVKASLDGIEYVKEDNKWYRQDKKGKKKINEFLGNENVASDTGTQEMIDNVVAFLANTELKKTDWWKNNHFTQYNFDTKTNSFTPVERPIYIWEQQTPTNPNFIEVKPAKGYYQYQVKPQYVNSDYEIMYKHIPTAKEGKYINKRYIETQKDPVKTKFLQYLTDKYNKIQEILPDNHKMGHVLPAIVKTEGENAVNTTNKILSFDGTFKDMFATNAGETDTDTSFLLGGSQSNDKTIPIRFTGKIDTSKQTKNALASILLFEYHASLYQALNEQLPLFEASQLLAAKVDTLEKKNYVEKLGITDKIRKIFHPTQEENEKTQQRNIEKTILSKTVDNILDVFVYGQRIKPMIVNLGPFGNADLAKVSTTVLGYAAKAIFVGNIISSINNSLSTRLQAVVNSGVKSKLYSLKNLTNAQAIASSPRIARDLLSDWTKLGNKSLIGQILDRFSFLAENPSREITNKSEFTLLKNKTEFLTSAKQMSEFEVLFVQFLTIADATSVKVNGKETKLSKYEDIFEIGKDGNLKMKDGVEFTKEQETTFRNKFQSMARKLQGAYRVTEISTIETNWAGKSALFLRRFFVAMATNRFAGERWNSQEQEIQIGYQRDTFNNLVKMFKDYSNLGMQQWEKMSDKEKSNFYKTILEYSILFTLIGLLGLAGGDDEKKDLKKNSYLHNLYLVALIRAKSEMEQFTAKGGDDLIRIGKNPFMVFNTLGNAWKIIGLSGPTVIGSDNAFYKQTTGLHDKGDSKMLATLLKLVGYTGATFHPEEYYVNFKNAQNR